MLGDPNIWRPDTPGSVPEGAVKLWLVALDEVPHIACLSDDERIRAAAAINLENGQRYRAVRTALRLLLAGATAQNPADLLFSYGSTRQPFLAWPPQAGIDFSLAYREQVALIALSRAGSIGVDIETIDQAVPAFDIAASEFAAPELKALASVSEVEVATAFTKMWVRKEAVAKLRGAGLWHGLETLPALEGEGPARDVTGLPPGLVGAYAIESNSADIVYAQLRFIQQPD